MVEAAFVIHFPFPHPPICSGLPDIDHEKVWARESGHTKFITKLICINLWTELGRNNINYTSIHTCGALHTYIVCRYVE